jgi:hypothetical protein
MTRQQPRQRRQQDAVSITQIGTVDLTAQHGDLMPEHENLDLLGPVTTHQQDGSRRTWPRMR